MRDIYYQPVGNTLQLDRLPASRPTIGLISRSNSPVERAAATVAGIAIAMLVGGFTVLIYRPPGWSWLEPYDLLFALPVVLAVLSYWSLGGGFQTLLHPLFLAAVTLLCVNHQMPWSLLVVVIAVASGLLVYAFGLHAVTIRTASPVPRETAAAIRDAACWQLAAVAVVAALLVASLLWFSSSIPKLACLTLPVAAFLAPRPKGSTASRAAICCESIVAWFGYDALPLPGLLQSPTGEKVHRTSLTLFAAVLTSIALVRWEGTPLPDVISLGKTQHAALTEEFDARGAGRFERFKYGALTWGLTFFAAASLPIVIPLTLASSLTMPVSLDADATAAVDSSQTQPATESQAIVNDIRSSPDLIERRSLYLGRIVADDSPVLVPRDVLREHAHGLGDSGSGKTSLFLCPIIEQLVTFGDCSVIVLDLKADTLELLATMVAAAQRVRRERGLAMPLRFFSNQSDRATFAFNPMTQPFWSKFDLLTRTDILCGANGLTYGSDYGQGFYSSANAAVLHQTLKTFPEVTTFRELADCIGNVITVAKKRELHPEIRKAGVHVHEVIKRLAACEPLNVTPTSGHGDDVVQGAIDLTQVFREPQLLYFHLSATLSPSGAPEIARLVNYMLLAAATQTERKHPVFLVIDEFQRMVASNLEYMLQLARSMGVGVILANQSMEDLRRSTTNLIPAIEANCRLRQWFSVSSSDDQQRLIRSSGETIDLVLSRSVSEATNGTRTSYSRSERVVNRFTLNDVLLTSDHPFRSFLRISRGDGYAQYGGLPVIVESSFHITEDEYRRRRAMPWPHSPGSFVPAEHRKSAVAVPVRKGPVWTQEVIGEVQPSNHATDAAELDGFFDQFKETIAKDGPRRRRKKS